MIMQHKAGLKPKQGRHPSTASRHRCIRRFEVADNGSLCGGESHSLMALYTHVRGSVRL
jgi:hypothetical protein